MTALLLSIVLFGQLVYSALSFRLGVGSPSYPVWLSLYALTCWFLVIHIKKLRWRSYDLIMLLFFLYIFYNYFLFGMSDSSEFLFKMATVVVLPYLIGRVLGRVAGANLISMLLVMFLVYLALVGVEFILDPAILTRGDRLSLYNEDYYGNNSTGGDGTLQAIGLTLGSTWTVAFAIYMRPKLRLVSEVAARFSKDKFLIQSNKRLLFSVLVVPLVIFSIGSRSSIAAMVLAGCILLFFSKLLSRRKKRKGLSKKLLLLLVTVIGLATSYQMLPESKKALLREFGTLLDNVEKSESAKRRCSEEGSFDVRLTMWRESIQMFSQSPVVGIGATNFGYYYCDGKKQSFASPHSIGAHVMAELGLVGLLILGALISSLVSNVVSLMKVHWHDSHLTIWTIFSIWIYLHLHLNFIGNLFIDYHLYLLTGVLASVLQPRRIAANIPRSTAGANLCSTDAKT